MDACLGYVVRLSDGARVPESAVGGKGAKLAALAAAGFHVPEGFCLTTMAYQRFLSHAGLIPLIRMELGRKPLDNMRWEELWDAALRIRSLFASAPMSEDLVETIERERIRLGAHRPLAIRSSAPGEDDAMASFAGIHESVIDVLGHEEVLNAVRTVWASLFSDAAILYRRELGLDPMLSRMAVVVQPLVDATPSGVAFARNPTEPAADHAVVEAVPGPCSDLVDGLVEPDRWLLDAIEGHVLKWAPGDRGKNGEPIPLLGSDDLSQLVSTLREIEAAFGWPPDIEWTGRGEGLTLLQARPISTVTPPEADIRQWYLSLRPSRGRLKALAHRVADQLIPELAELGERFSQEPIETYGDVELARAIDTRQEAFRKWQQVYHDEFIPFAHGVRQLGIYYNDAVRPDDPYEFVELLSGQEMAASRRNAIMLDLASLLRQHGALAEYVDELVSYAADDWWQRAEGARALPGGQEFVTVLQRLLSEHMDITHGDNRLSTRPELIVRSIVKLSRLPEPATTPSPGDHDSGRARVLERRLFDAVGQERRAEAEEVLAIGRLSWRLRDDDNLLIGRLESQLLRAIAIAGDRLRRMGRLGAGWAPTIGSANAAMQALRDRSASVLLLSESRADLPAEIGSDRGRPRQLVGQPAAHGVSTGRVRRIVGLSGMADFEPGEVLVCDAIQPSMTHLVPLASAIVERRGGMLIHGAIIARELGIPCVNGIADAVNILHDGEMVTVDGYLGIVTVGPPEFGLEGIDPVM